jgi:hypothetical protein
MGTAAAASTRAEFLLNGRTVAVGAAPIHTTLLDFIRAQGLTGAKWRGSRPTWLDTARGVPAAGVEIQLHRLDAGGWWRPRSPTRMAAPDPDIVAQPMRASGAESGASSVRFPQALATGTAVLADTLARLSTDQ